MTSGYGPPPSDGYQIVVGSRRSGDPGYAPNAAVGREPSTKVGESAPTGWVTPTVIGDTGCGGGGGGG